MAAGLQVRELPAQELATWDLLVRESPQGTIFSESLWLQAMRRPFRVFGCWKGEELAGGIAVVEDSSRPRSTSGIPPFTPFLGILVRDAAGMRDTTRESRDREVSFALIRHLHQEYDHLTVPLHYTYRDVRPFYWETFGQPREYVATIRYTYVVDLRDLEATWSRFDDNTRFEVRKAEKRGSSVGASDDICAFEQMYRRTFERQGIDAEDEARQMRCLYDALKPAGRAQIFLAHNAEGAVTSGAVAVWDAKRAYYLLGASEPAYRNDGSASLTLWRMFQSVAARLPEIDLVGCNSPRRGAFKAGFGGLLQPYFVMSIARESTLAAPAG